MERFYDRAGEKYSRFRQRAFPARQRKEAFFFLFRFHVSAMRKTALLGFSIGVVLGCLFGVVIGVLPGDNDKSREQPEMLSVNQRTGKPQLHIKGKPEIK